MSTYAKKKKTVKVIERSRDVTPRSKVEKSKGRPKSPCAPNTVQFQPLFPELRHFEKHGRVTAPPHLTVTRARSPPPPPSVHWIQNLVMGRRRHARHASVLPTIFLLLLPYLLIGRFDYSLKEYRKTSVCCSSGELHLCRNQALS